MNVLLKLDIELMKIKSNVTFTLDYIFLSVKEWPWPDTKVFFLWKKSFAVLTMYSRLNKKESQKSYILETKHC